LNEWRTLEAGHYRVYAISHRVWRAPDPTEKTPYDRVSEVVRSNAVEFDVRPPDPKWQAEELGSALQALAGPSSREDARRAARRLRFLNTRDSTRQLARLFWGLSQDQPETSDLMLGLLGSPYRSLAIDSMHEQIAVPDHAITTDFLRALVDLEVSADPSWEPPAGASPEATQAFWRRQRAHLGELTKSETEKAVAAVPGKSGRARALTLYGLLTASRGQEAGVETMRSALIAAWADLPRETQDELIRYRWPLIAGPEMLPILRGVAEEPPPYPQTVAITRDAALERIQELDPVAGCEFILRDLQSQKAQPSMGLIKLLPRDDLLRVTQSAVERVAHHEARELDYELVDRYADGAALGRVGTVFVEHLGRWSCAPQSAMLRYFLRVDPAYGAKQVSASLGARKDTGCYRSLLGDLDGALPIVQESAILALDDPDVEVVRGAATALGRWGSADAEAPLWGRLRRLHEAWVGREGQLRWTPDPKDPGSQGARLEQALTTAIAKGNSWTCGTDKLPRLAALASSRQGPLEIGRWLKQWAQATWLINPSRSDEGKWTFSVLQYDSLTEEQLRGKLAQFPRGSQLLWHSWSTGQTSPSGTMAEEEALYERMRSVAETSGVTLGKANRKKSTGGLSN
jgi:hypothetical protein